MEVSSGGTGRGGKGVEGISGEGIDRKREEDVVW